MKVNQAESKVNQATRLLAMLELKAPVDGYMEYARHWSGDKIAVGMQLYPTMGIVKIPDLSVMQVKLQLGENAAQQLRKSMEAIITIPSLDGLKLAGKVTKVDKIAKPVRTGRKMTKVKRVEVIVEFDSTGVPLAPGLTAYCRILVDKAEDVLTVPKECVFEKDSVKVVYAWEDGFYVPHAVSIEKRSEDFVALLSDLQGGEQCALLEPTPAHIKWPKTLNVPPPREGKRDSFQISTGSQERGNLNSPGPKPNARLDEIVRKGK